jgi:3-keto-disaccharide hydrolase
MLSALSLLILAAGPFDRAWSFDNDQVGGPPQGFYFDTTNDRPEGKWQVVDDGDRRVTAQLDRNQDNNRLALAIAKDLEAKDIRLSARIKVVAGDKEQSGGLVWRYKDSENYLLARIDQQEKNVRLYRVVDGNRTRFGGEQRNKLALNQWYTLRIEHRGTLVKVYLDDEMLFDERDRHFTKAGKIGLWTKADSVVHFDDLRVQELTDE